MQTQRTATFGVLLALVCLVSCTNSNAPRKLPVKAMNSAKLILKMNGLEFEDSIALDSDASHRSAVESFSSSDANNRKFETSISYCFVGKIELTDAFDLEEGKQTGDLIAVRVSLHDPKTNDLILDESIFTIYSGEQAVVFDREGVKLTIKPEVEKAE